MELDVRYEGQKAYIDVASVFCGHKRCKNYIAHITGKDPKYGLKREFLKPVDDRLYDEDEFKEGEIYEFKSVYYSARGRRHDEFYGLFIYKGINDNDNAEFEEIDKAKALAILEGRFVSDKVKDLLAEIEADPEKEAVIRGLQIASTLNTQELKTLIRLLTEDTEE